MVLTCTSRFAEPLHRPAHPVPGYPAPLSQGDSVAHQGSFSADCALALRMGRTTSRLISAVAEEHRTLLQDIFTLEYFLVLQCKPTSSLGIGVCRLSEWPTGDSRFIVSFFDSWVTLQPLANTEKPAKNTSIVDLMDSHPQIGAFVRFVCGLSIEDARKFVNYITRFLKPFTSRGKSLVTSCPASDLHARPVTFYGVNYAGAVEQLYKRHPGLPRPDGLHPCWSFLCIAAFLAYYSATLAELFFAARAVELVEDMFTHGFPRPAEDSGSNGTQGVMMELASHILLSAVNKHHKFDSEIKDSLAKKFGPGLAALTELSLQTNLARSR